MLGQATTGSISGHVSDPAGAAVPGAHVSIHNVDNGLITQAVTDGHGDFNQTAMPPDNYTISVEIDGFETAKVPSFKLDIDQKARFELPLKVGAITAEVTVTDTAPVLQEQGAETGQVIGAREIEDLPTAGRDFTTLLLLVPGVSHGLGGNNLSISVNGQREFANSFQINGVEVSGTNNDTNVRPSPDAIQEFKVVTSSYAPEFGRSGAGSVLIQTKSGTNQLHGTVFGLYRPTLTAANGNFAPAGTAPTLQQKDFSGTIGGPVIRDKAFLFLAFERISTNDSYSEYDTTLVGQNQVTYLPNGDVDLSKLTDPYTGKQVPIFDPFFFANNYYTSQFPGNIIPAADIDPGGRNIAQKLFPAPRGSYTSDPYENFQTTVPYNTIGNTGNLRFDYTFSQNNRVYLTYDAQQGDYNVSDPYAGAISIPGGGGADTGLREAYENHSVALTYDHTFTPSLLNEARATYLVSPTTEKSLVDGTNLATQFGIHNANIPGFPQTYGFPQIQFGSGATTGGSTFNPLTSRLRALGLYDSVEYTHAKHNAKFGYEYRLVHSISSYSLFPTPYEYFAGAGSNFTSDPYYGYYDPSAYYYNGGAEIADLLLGLPEVVLQGLQFATPDTSYNEHSAYVQDYWQISPHVNITYGVRYEYRQPYVESQNRQSNFDISTLNINLAGRGSNSRSLLFSNTSDLMPRVGIDYQIRPSTVLRGGFGLFYSPEDDSKNVILTQNYPFYTEQEYNNSVYNYYYGYTLSQGVARPTSIPIASGVSSIHLPSVAGASTQIVNSVPQNFPTGFTKSYNVALQQQLSPSATLDISFVGANGRNLSDKVGDYNINQRLSTNIGHVNTLLPIGLSNYSSLQAKLEKHLTSGFGALVSYTWAHALDNGPAPPNLGKNGDGPQNPYDISSEYSNSDIDVRNTLVGSAIMELPVGRGKHFLHNANGITQAFLGGWQVNSITTLEGGRPFNIVSNPSNANYPELRPNLVGNPHVAHRTKTQWFNPAAFQVPAGQAASTAAGATVIFGNAPRNLLYGPGYTDEDISVFKKFAITKRMGFQLRVEAFNVLNTSRYGVPNNNASQLSKSGSPGFGSITGSNGNVNNSPRFMQFDGRFTF